MLKLDTLKVYGVRVKADLSGFILPVFDFSGNLTGIKILSSSRQPSGNSVKVLTEIRTIPRLVLYLLLIQLWVVSSSGIKTCIVIEFIFLVREWINS